MSLASLVASSTTARNTSRCSWVPEVGAARWVPRLNTATLLPVSLARRASDAGAATSRDSACPQCGHAACPRKTKRLHSGHGAFHGWFTSMSSMGRRPSCSPVGRKAVHVLRAARKSSVPVSGMSGRRCCDSLYENMTAPWWLTLVIAAIPVAVTRSCISSGVSSSRRLACRLGGWGVPDPDPHSWRRGIR